MVVLDSSFLVAIHNRRDVHHTEATRILGPLLEGRWGEGVLLEYVFLEVVTVLQARVDLATALYVGEQLLSAQELIFLPCSDIFRPTLQTFATQGSLGLSFADAAIATVARREPPGNVATFDRAFDALDGVTVVKAD